MKITFVMAGGFNLTGGERVIAAHAKHLRQRGHEVYIVSSPHPPASLRQQVRALLKGQGWILNTESEPSHIRYANIPHKLLDTSRPVVDADVPDADVVIATWWETAEWVANLSPSKGAKVYFIQHHEVFDYLPKERVEASYFLPLHKIVVSQWLLSLMQKRYGDFNTSLVLNSVDIDQFNAPLRGKQPQPTVGMVYSSNYWKGSDISLNAFAIASQRIPNLRLVAFGGERPSPKLPLPLGAEFVYRPSQTELKNLYAACDAWLFGSRSEGFGLPILEAMACRTPVIGTPSGATTDLLPTGGGVIVNEDDPKDMAQAIELLCTLPEDAWQCRSAQAYARASQYSWKDATALFEAALLTAIDRQQQGELRQTDRSICP
ncbi:glycosyl transferase family 1 [filamentous cyanobacterium CCP1]|nr:glycosyl transferase family 1 [filamentous cyanobacterium CCP2]PSB67854.1 glycosyl transferase family 1 [filamentous cyanobacterium CCP1]